MPRNSLIAFLLMIVVPFIILIVVIANPSNDTNKNAQQTTYPTPIISPQSDKIASFSGLPGQPGTGAASIDLVGPWVCKTPTVELSIYNRQIYAKTVDKTTTTQFLLTGDCVYSWTGTKGEKQCGITQYLNLFDTLMGSGMIDMRSILQSQAGLAGIGSGVDIGAVLDSCEKKTVDATVFVMPKSVVFVETPTMQTAP